MKKTRGAKSVKPQSTPAVRASISFPPALYETLEDIAKEKKVSLAWVVRDAAEKYVADATASQNRAHNDASRRS
jgi:metal-responsive CopG/Arc/MetJ family transcriptional regulator